MIINRDSEYAEILTPESVAQWLATNEWSCSAEGPAGQIWTPVDARSDLRGIMLPTDSSFADFGRRFKQAIASLTEQYDWDLGQLAESIATVRADLFFVRVDQSMKDGTIPFRQATQLLENIDQMIKSAALAAYNPNHSGKGKIPGVVNEFLNEDLRMGHTKRGSFIITVAARHDFPSNNQRELAPAVPHPEPYKDADTTFTRKVMTTLSTALDATQRHISKQSNFLDLEQIVTAGVRLPMVEALSDMSSTEGLRGLDMSFDWSHSQPKPENVPSSVKFDVSNLDELNVISTRLRRKIEPQEETLVGPVTELRRAEHATTNEEIGEIVLRADVDGQTRNVRVELSGQDYDAAIRAHQSRGPIVVSGMLGKKGRSWALTGNVTVNASLLPKQ